MSRNEQYYWILKKFLQVLNSWFGPPEEGISELEDSLGKISTKTKVMQSLKWKEVKRHERWLEKL